MAAELLSTETPAQFQVAVKRAAELLRAGEVVALPTETVYGLAANAFDPAAVARIYEIKGRPAHNPIIVHVASWELARRCAAPWPVAAERLARAFWPGPLTIVLPRAPAIPDVVTAGGATVGLRWPAHPFIQAVIRECGFPLAAPSANRSNEVSPTSAAHVLRSLGDRLPLIVDGGPSAVGIESTVVDLSEAGARVLRPGMIHEEIIAATLDEGVQAGSTDGRLRSPGLLPKHYSPRAHLVVLAWNSAEELLRQAAERGIDVSRSVVIAHSCLPAPEGWAGVHVIPHDAEAYARALYAEWHRCDETGVGWIVMEAVPATPEWRGIADRLRRAATA
ncbi:MAG TPA: L-threonylcarbamoyladenylate synthase [Verrucomicrobiae bacterium]|nr:L-threonylcarbamoyladenylate synthase [Verrucomicrobiae bacterium]